MNWIEDFIDYLRYEKNYSHKTTEMYQADLEAFKRFYEATDNSLSWAEMPADIVRQWVVEMMERGNVATSVRRRLSSLRSFYKFLLRRGLVTKDPVYNMPGPKVEKKLPSYIREAEMDRLFDGDFFAEDYTGIRDRMILLTFYSTGIRLAELVGLNVRDIDLDQMQLKVTGKRNKQRIIPYGDEFGDSIRYYLAERKEFMQQNVSEQPCLFFDEITGQRINPVKVRNLVKRYLSMVTTQQRKSPHVLRHSFATAMLNRKADLQSVKELLGHESLSTTEIYTHTTFDQLKEMYNQAHPRAKYKKGGNYGNQDSGNPL